MIRTFKLLAGAFCLLFAQGAIAQVAQWTLSEASGRVLVRDTGGEHAGRRGMTVAPGATLSTGPGARAVVVRGKDFVTVAANSRVRIPTAAQNSGGFDVVQEWGNAVFQIEKKKNPHFGVRTPYLAAVVKGTTFLITVTQDGASLQVLEGAVETSTSDGGARELIRPGIVASVSAADQFRLTVRGSDVHTIDSPARGAAPAAKPQTQQQDEAPAPGGAAVTPASGSAAEQGASSADLLAVQTLSETITAQPTDLGKATGGLVGGTNVVQLASAEVAAITRVDNGRSGSSGSGNGQGNNGNGNGNGGASSGSGTDTGTGNSGNGQGNNGNGNGNGGASSGSGTDAGTGNSGNGQGNNGNGNGNGGASPGSSTDAGTANSGNGQGNNGNGNGNGGASSGSGTDVAVDVGVDTVGTPGNGKGKGGGKDNVRGD